MQQTPSITEHRLELARQQVSPNCDARPTDEISLIVIHGISLPAGQFGGQHVEALFCNRLDPASHPEFTGLDSLRVSSHLFVRRDGTVIQFVPFNRRAWHAGFSAYQGRPDCNDFSIGIELEGADTAPYEDAQYQLLAQICPALIRCYDIDARDVVGHCDIAPGRKTDPGPAFDWQRFREDMAALGRISYSPAESGGRNDGQTCPRGLY